MDQLSRYIEPLKFQALDRMESLKIIEEKTKVKPSVLLLIVFVLLLLLSPIFKTHTIMTSLVCYLIPAYLSFLALESKDKEDDIRYLTYWIIFSVAEVGTPLLRLFFNRFTYMVFRIFITLVLLHPESPACSLIYNKAVKPFLSEHEKTIDKKLDELAKEGKKKIVEGVQEGLNHL